MCQGTIDCADYSNKAMEECFTRTLAITPKHGVAAAHALSENQKCRPRGRREVDGKGLSEAYEEGEGVGKTHTVGQSTWGCPTARQCDCEPVGAHTGAGSNYSVAPFQEYYSTYLRIQCAQFSARETNHKARQQTKDRGKWTGAHKNTPCVYSDKHSPPIKHLGCF
jgi:hypothetical protein